MKRILTLLALIVSTSFAISQTLTTQVRPVDSKEWGYIDIKGNMIIEPRFRKCYAFSEGLAPIYEKKEKSYHFIDLKGERLSTEIPKFIVIEGMGFGVKGFSEGLIAMRVTDKWGFLSKDGKLAIATKYSKVSNFSDGIAVARMGEKTILLDKTGKETPITDSKIKVVKKFSEGLAPFHNAERKYGFIDKSGNIVIESKFMSVGYFQNGLAWAKAGDGKIGFINSKGEWAIEAKFLSAKNFDKEAGLARVKYQDKWTYVSTTGEINNIDISLKWGDFSEGLAQGKIESGLMGFYNAAGEWAIEPAFQGVRDFKNGYAAAKKDNKWGFIDKSGKWVIEPIYGAVKDMEISD